MPSYSYKAFDSEGSIQSGFINADSERSARKEKKSLIWQSEKTLPVACLKKL